jgi:hypothetical protein
MANEKLNYMWLGIQQVVYGYIYVVKNLSVQTVNETD